MIENSGQTERRGGFSAEAGERCRAKGTSSFSFTLASFASSLCRLFSGLLTKMTFRVIEVSKYSQVTVTDFAKARGLSIFLPKAKAV